MTKKENKTWGNMETVLAKAVGTHKSVELLAAAKQKSDGWLAATKETSKSRLKMMREGIVPRIAVYAVLKENGYDPVPAFDDYVRNVAGPAMHKTYAKAEKIRDISGKCG